MLASDTNTIRLGIEKTFEEKMTFGPGTETGLFVNMPGETSTNEFASP